MSTISNIELFNGIVGKIFASLYTNFPVYSDINTDLILEELMTDHTYDGLNVLDDIAESTVNWLIQAGYIIKNDDGYCDDDYIQGVLSAKALEVLKAIPDSLTNTDTLGDKVVKSAKGSFNSALNKAVGEAISIGVKFVAS